MNNIKRNITTRSRSLLKRVGQGLHHKALLMAALAALTGVASCSDWDDHYDNAGAESSNASLWEQISSNPELSDFAEVLQNTMVFRHHKKTPVSYAQVLSGGQSLTVLAPINGTFNKDSLIALTQTAEGDSSVEVFFVKNHLATTLRSASDTTQTFRLMNGKRINIQGDNVNGVAIKEGNLHGKNGVLHVLQAENPYTYTIYEALNYVPEFTLSGSKLKGYNEDYFDENASVSSGVVDGVPVYVDSVLYERNIMMNAIGQLNAEDSTFSVTIPTNDGWQKAWDRAAAHFVYPANMEKRDSLQNYWTSRALFDDAVFSKTIQSSPNDSVISYHYSASHPEYHVFYKPYASDGLFGKAKGTRKCSNGTLYYYDEWPFTPEQTYFKKIEQEAEQVWQIANFDKCTYTAKSLAADSISKGAFVDIKATTGTANWSITYKLDGTLSGAYDFCIVTLPRNVDNPKTALRPYKFKATINYIDENGDDKQYQCNGGNAITTAKDVVDTIVVAEAFKLPACNYSQSNARISLTITCDISARENAKYWREMYLDCIFLRPNETAESQNN